MLAYRGRQFKPESTEAVPRKSWNPRLSIGFAALEDNPPAAVLLTNSQWPQPDGFDAADRWPQFAALLASRYVLDRSESKNGLAWRLYLIRPLRSTSPEAYRRVVSSL